MNTRNPSPKIPLNPTCSDSHLLSLFDGRLHVDGQWVFLKIAKPQRNFADPREVQQLIDDLPVLQAKHYNAICAQALRADLSRGRTLVDIAKRLRERTDFVEACAARLGLRSPYRTGRKVARRRGTDRGRRNRTATLRA